MELTSLQLSTTKQILELYNPNSNVICEFTSPTGSGKTLMASYFISALIEQNPNDKFIFVIATPSSADLPYFFEQKLNKYKVDLPYSKFEVEYIQSPSTGKTDRTESINKIIPERNKVYIFGKASFGRGRILSEYGIINDFVVSAIDKGYKLIYIRDEAHNGGEPTNNDENFETLMNGNASFVLRMTATPSENNHITNRVILRESDLNNPVLNEGKWLLKTTPKPLLNEDLENKEVLENAIGQFKKIKDEYAKLKIGIHPAMLIQVDNSAPSNPEEKREFEKSIKEIKEIFKKHNVVWVQYFGNNDKDSDRVYKSDFTLDDITENSCTVDAIIFKIGPSTGWDIPRACMLVQLRKVCSRNLNIQTVGRIKRNPYPNLEFNEITSKYYIYSNPENPNDNSIKEYNYKVREKFSNETFLSIDIVNKSNIVASQSNKQFAKDFNTWFNDNANWIIQEIGKAFENGEYKKILNISNGHQIYTLITNPFIFLRDYNKLIASNRQLYDLIESSVDVICNKYNARREFLITILLVNHKRDIHNIISATKTRKPIYKISEQPYDPISYKEIYGQDKIERGISRRDYLFGINEDDRLNANQQPLDSEPEIIAFNIIKEFTDDNEGVKLWAKNLIKSNIFGEYLDDMLNVKKSYFDFIVKFDNGFYLYIEVKGIPDINKDKTEQLKNAYTDYFVQRIDDLFSSKLAIAVWEIDNNGIVHSSVYYDKKSISDDLNKLSANQLLHKLANLS